MSASKDFSLSTIEGIKTIDHFLVPKHELVKPDKEKDILEQFRITKEQLPKIWIYDPAIQNFEAKVGDIIRILRNEEGIKNTYYRVVTE